MARLRLHGPPQLTLDDGRPLPLSARESALLCWLHLVGPTPRPRLAGLLWPAGSEAQARANLRQTLARLRRAAGEVLAEDDGVLRLASNVALDTAAGGELLAGLQFDDAPEFAEWLNERRDDASRGWQRERLARAQAGLAQGDLDGALALADEVLARDAESEQAWRLRMEVCFLRGDRAAAIAAWDACRDALRRAFGVAPSAETNELGTLILASAGPAVAPGVLPAALRRPPHLIGRTDVLAALQHDLQLRHAVVVTGPGGIGKSRLLAQALAAFEPALIVAARAGDGELPGASLARLLSAAFKRFTPDLDAATRRDVTLLLPDGGRALSELKSALEHRRVLDAAARALQACAQRGLRVVAFDDLQFADDESIAAMRVLVGAWLAGEEAGREAGVIPLLAARATELSEAGRALLAELADSRRSARIDLAPLGPADVRVLLDELPVREAAPQLDLDALAAALHAQVGGNPAFLLESLKSLWLEGLADWRPGQALPVPASLVESLRRRLQRLPEDALQVAQLAAVAQRDFSVGLAGAALGRTPLALAPVFAALEAAQVFHGHAFSHDLVAESVRAALPAALEAPLHQLVADHLIAQDGTPASIAHHLTAAGALPSAAPWWLRAADEARARWQMADAARGYEAAAKVLGAAGEDAAPQRELGGTPRAAAVRAWRQAARCWGRADRGAAAFAALDQADALAHTERERLLNASARVALQVNAHALEESVQTARALARALRGDGQRELDGAELGEAARFICATVPYGLPVDEALALCSAVQVAVAAAGAEAQVGLHSAIGTALHWDARLREADERLTAALAGAGEAVDASVRIYIGNRLARVRHTLGEADRALEVGLATLALAERQSAGIGARTDLMHILGMMQIGIGRAAAGLEMLHRAVALQDDRISLSDAADMAVAHVAVGRLDEAQHWLARTGLTGGSAFALHDLGALLARARLAAARGEAAPEAVPGLHGLLAGRIPIGPALLIRAVLLRWQPPDARAVDTLLDDLRARDMKSVLRCALNGAARAALARGEHARAAGHAREALRLAGHVDIWCEMPAEVWWTAHEVLQGCGHAQEARAALREGAAWVEAGANQWASAADREAWRLGHALHRALLQSAAEAGLT